MNEPAAEYVHDDKQAEQIQGKLATDRVDEDEGDDDKEEVKDKDAEGEADDPDDMPMEEA